MKKEIVKNTVIGQHLWSVEIVYFTRINLKQEPWKNTANLWITTKHKSMPIGLMKTRTFLKNQKIKYPNAQIEGITYSGTVDD